MEDDQTRDVIALALLGLSIALQMLARLLLMVPTAILTLRGGFGVEEQEEFTADLFDLRRRRRSIETPTEQNRTDGPLDTTAASLLLILPLVFHWALLILLYARLNIVSFWRLSLKRKVLHILSNTLVTLPVRKTGKGEQVHKAREIFWSLVLVGLNLLVTALVTSALVSIDLHDNPVSEDKYGRWIFVGSNDPEMCDDLSQCKSTDTLTRFFLESSTGFGEGYPSADGSGNLLIKFIIPKFFLCFGLPSLLCHVAGSLLLLLQYKLVHPSRHLGRAREANLWGKLGGSKKGLDVEMSQWKRTEAVS